MRTWRFCASTIHLAYPCPFATGGYNIRHSSSVHSDMLSRFSTLLASCSLDTCNPCIDATCLCKLKHVLLSRRLAANSTLRSEVWLIHIYGCVRKFRCQQSVLHGGYDSEVCFEVCFGGMIRGMIRPTFFTVYIKTMSYIKGADWAMAQQSEVWVWFGVWFEEMQHACGHKFCIRNLWTHSYIYYIYQKSLAVSSCRLCLTFIQIPFSCRYVHQSRLWNPLHGP